MDDLHLKNVREGDINSFSFFIDKYKDIAYSIAIKIVKNEQDAEEIVQDSFVKAYKAINNFKGNAKFSTWLYKIVFNTSISQARLKSLRTESLNEHSYESNNFVEINAAIQNLTEQERKKYIKLALGNLDEIDYTILTLYYYEEKNIKDIGEIINLKSSYIKVRLHRARGKLYFELKKILKEEVNEIIKAIISTGIVTPPSEDFNEKIMNRIISHSMTFQYNKFPAFNIIKLFIVTLTLMVITFNLTLIFNYFFDFFELSKIVLSLGQVLMSLYSSPVTHIGVLSLMSICVLILFDRFLSSKFKFV